MIKLHIRTPAKKIDFINVPSLPFVYFTGLHCYELVKEMWRLKPIKNRCVRTDPPRLNMKKPQLSGGALQLVKNTVSKGTS